MTMRGTLPTNLEEAEPAEEMRRLRGTDDEDAARLRLAADDLSVVRDDRDLTESPLLRRRPRARISFLCWASRLR